MAKRRPRAGWRRFASITVLVASCVALLATSQPPEESRLVALAQVGAQLTAESPRASGTVRLAISADALPLPVGALHTVSGFIRLAQPPDQHETVVLSVEASGLEVAARTEYGDTLIDIEQLCRIAEPCDRELEVSLEWLGATPGSSIQAMASVTVEIVYQGIVENPVGAVASVEQLEDMRPMSSGPQVRAQTDEEQIILDASHWAAARHVVLTSTAAARNGRIVAFLDRAVGQAVDSDVLVSIVPDERPGEALSALDPFEPFVSCPSRDDCVRGFTVRFELAPTDADAVATVRWSFGARAAFSGVDVVPRGAELAVDVDRAADATDGAPRIEAVASGTFEPPDLEVDDRFVYQDVAIEMRGNSASLPTGVFEGLPPAARAVLTVRGAVDASVNVTVESGSRSEVYTSPKLTSQEPAFSVVFNPFRLCGVGHACTRTLNLRATTARPEGGASPVELTWDLEVIIAYPSLGAPPRLAEVQLVPTPGGS